VTRKEFVDAMAPLSVNFRRELTRPLMVTYFAEFQSVRPDDFRDAVTHLLRTAKFFPTIAEFRHALGMNDTPSLAEAGMVFDALLGPAPAYDPRLGDSWPLQVVHDRWGAVALAAFMAAGGPRAFRDRTDRDVPFLRRDFMRGWEQSAALPAAHRPALAPETAPRGLAPVTESLARLLPASGKDAAAGEAEHGDAWEPTRAEEAP